MTWVGADEAVAMVDAGEMLMLPPTYLTCREVAGLAGPAEVLAAARTRVVEMFTPEVVEVDGEFTLSTPP